MTNSSVELPTSVVDSTSVLSTPSTDVNPTSVGKSRTMVNPISGLLTSLTEQQQQHIAQATVDAMSLTSDVLARHTLSHSGDSDRSLNVPTFSESALAQTKLSKTLRKKQREAVEKLRSSIPSRSYQSVVVSASALPSSPMLSTASADVSSTLFDNTVVPSRFNPYQDKTLVLKGKFDRKTALQVAHNLLTIDCP